MENILRVLLMAQRCAHVHHWKTKSFSLHLALGELYDKLTSFADDLAELYLGKYGSDNMHIAQSDPNGFSEQDPIEFVRALFKTLEDLEHQLPSDGFIVNKYQELQGEVARIKFKMENLK